MTTQPLTDRLAARRGSYRDHAAQFPEVAETPAPATPPARPRLNGLLAALCDELHAEGVADPLAARLSVAAVWSDLARLAGESLPEQVADYLDEDVCGLDAHRYALARAAVTGRR